jgi:hypothetical protein
MVLFRLKFKSVQRVKCLNGKGLAVLWTSLSSVPFSFHSYSWADRETGSAGRGSRQKATGPGH